MNKDVYKTVFGPCSTPDPAGGAYDAPLDPLIPNRRGGNPGGNTSPFFSRFVSRGAPSTRWAQPPWATKGVRTALNIVLSIDTMATSAADRLDSVAE